MSIAKKFILILLLIILYRCSSDSPINKNTVISDSKDKCQDSLIVIEEKIDSIFLIDFFIDSSEIGLKGQNKLEVKLFEVQDSFYVWIDFFSKSDIGWESKNHFEFETDGIYGIDPITIDFNNDNFNDFHYKALVAARASNDVRRLFVYDSNGDSLILIKNSLDYPNMMYNKKLNCVDAWMIHGCSSQVFLDIINDSLVGFARIESYESTIVYEIDRQGKEKVILYDSVNRFGCLTRFLNYKPLVERSYDFNE